jgi:ankyrin repeat protein
MDASAHGHVEMVRFFIENGAELEITSKSGQTALILATGNGHLDCAGILIEAGADCDTSDSMGLSARKYAQLYQIDELLKLMPPSP